MKTFLFTLILVLSFGTPASAEKIKLKNGKEYEGRIIEKNNEYIRLQTETDLYKIPLNMMDQASRDFVAQLEITPNTTASPTVNAPNQANAPASAGTGTPKDTRSELEKSLEYGLTQAGLTMDEFGEISTFYYKDPQPDKLIKVLKVILAIPQLLVNQERFSPIAHLFATVANKDPIFFEKVNLLQNDAKAIQRQSLEGIIAESKQFYSPEPDSPMHLDFLWSEFIATGSTEPVVKIIQALSYPEKGMDNILLIGAAEWSLTANAKLHEKVYEIIKAQALDATGPLKQKLESILKSADSR